MSPFQMQDLCSTSVFCVQEVGRMGHTFCATAPALNLILLWVQFDHRCILPSRRGQDQIWAWDFCGFESWTKGMCTRMWRSWKIPSTTTVSPLHGRWKEQFNATRNTTLKSFLFLTFPMSVVMRKLEISNFYTDNSEEKSLLEDIVAKLPPKESWEAELFLGVLILGWE